MNSINHREWHKSLFLSKSLRKRFHCFVNDQSFLEFDDDSISSFLSIWSCEVKRCWCEWVTSSIEEFLIDEECRSVSKENFNFNWLRKVSFSCTCSTNFSFGSIFIELFRKIVPNLWTMSFFSSTRNSSSTGFPTSSLFPSTTPFGTTTAPASVSSSFYFDPISIHFIFVFE